MSGDILEQHPGPQDQLQTETQVSPKKETARKPLFGGNLNQDLSQALNSWEVLTEQMANKVSPEEEQLQEVKRLLGELKSKLKEFGE